MTHRALAPIKFFALSLGIRAVTFWTKARPSEQPEPIVESLKDCPSLDEWMFDREGLPVTEASAHYSHELNRVTGALTGLRNLLTQITAEAPLVDEIVARSTISPISSDDILFDGEPMAAYGHDVPVEDAELFVDDYAPKVAREELSRVA